MSAEKLGKIKDRSVLLDRVRDPGLPSFHKGRGQDDTRHAILDTFDGSMVDGEKFEGALYLIVLSIR